MASADGDSDSKSGMPQSDEQLAELFTRHRDHLIRMVQFRIDERLAQRLDPLDIVQEAFLNAQKRLHHVAEGCAVPVLVWLRQITEQTLIDLARRHLGAQQRAANKEVSLGQAAVGHTTSTSLAAMLVGNLSSPSQAALREERRSLLEQALEQMDPIDREVLALRHFEELSNSEVAEILGLSPTAASNRYVRALERLKQILQSQSYFASD